MSLAFSAAPDTDEGDHVLVPRLSPETFKAIWTQENSQITLNYAGSISALALAIGAFVALSSSSSSGCTVITQTVTVTKRSLETPSIESASVETPSAKPYYHNLTLFTDLLNQGGFDIDHSAWKASSENASHHVYDGVMSGQGAAIRNMSIADDMVSFRVGASAAANDSSTSSIQARTTAESNEVYVEFHATGKCYTTHTESQIQTGIKKVLKKIQNENYYASCWNLWFGKGAWLGHLKVLSIWNDGYSEAGYYQTCNSS